MNGFGFGSEFGEAKEGEAFPRKNVGKTGKFEETQRILLYMIVNSL
jgi:hypothetical protein